MSRERDLFRAIVVGGLGVGAALSPGCSCNYDPIEPDAAVADAGTAVEDASGPDAAVEDAGMVLII